MNKYVGYQETSSLHIQKGDRVVIPKGTPFTSTHPSRKTGVTKKKMVVTVHHNLCGQSVSEGEYQNGRQKGYYPENAPQYDRKTQYSWGEHSEPYRATSNPSIVYPGSGGYWVEIDMNLVEKVSE